MNKPVDKILCQRKFYRYVIACMHNCPNPHQCNEFWSFFEAKGVSPAEYYNENGIGDKVMRRVVFDCDRCGKKDLQEMFGPYDTGGESKENRLDAARRVGAIGKVGYASEPVTKITFSVMDLLEETKKWQHYCKKCFQKVVDNVAGILEERRQSSSKGDDAEPEVLFEAADEVEEPPEPEPEEKPLPPARPAGRVRGKPKPEPKVTAAPPRAEKPAKPELPAPAPKRKPGRPSRPTLAPGILPLGRK
jgi:hypothetical protein